MARSLSITVTDRYDNMRLDSFLFESGLYESRSKAVKQIEAGKVFVGGQTPNKKTLVHTGDFIVYEEYEANNRIFLEPQNIPLDVYYDDEDLAVINKQAGLICHPSLGHPDGTLSNALIARYGRDNLAHIKEMIVQVLSIVWMVIPVDLCLLQKTTKWVLNFKMKFALEMLTDDIYAWFMAISQVIRG